MDGNFAWMASVPADGEPMSIKLGASFMIMICCIIAFASNQSNSVSQGKCVGWLQLVLAALIGFVCAH